MSAVTATSLELVYGVGVKAVRSFLAKPALASSKACPGSLGIWSDLTLKNEPSAVPVYSG